MPARIASSIYRHALLTGLGCLVFATALPDFATAQSSTLGPNDIADVVDRVKPAVVGVRAQVKSEANDQSRMLDRLMRPPRENGTTGESRENPDTPRPRVGTNQGSGFFISADGYVVTTNHLVEGAQTIEITTDDDRKHQARLVGSDATTDLALLKVDAPKEFPFARISERTPRIGEWIVAVGNPFGLGSTVTAGIVSARARDLKIGMFNDFVQIDAPVNQGNSGGPAFNLQGDVIGVNSAILSPTGGSVGIGFAVPADIVSDVVSKLRERGSIVRGWMGVQIQTLTPDLAEAFGVKASTGALVIMPQPNSPAAKAGLQPGDVITAVDGKAVKDDRELVKRIGDLAPGATVGIDVSRKGDRKTMQVTLADMPAGRKATPAGIPTR